MLKQEEYKCFICGSAKHMAPECDRPKKDAKGSTKGDHTKKGGKGHKGKPDGGKGKPSVNSLTRDDEEKQDAKSERSLARDTSDPKEPENEPILEAFQTMIVKALKERSSTSTSSQGEDLDDVITSLKKKLDAKVKTIRINKATSSGRKGLLDSGATNNVREVKRDEDFDGVVPIEVSVAFESEVQAQLFINREGTILGPKGTETIVSMNALVEVGFEVNWKSGSIEKRREEETLEVQMINGLPMLDDEKCLKLIDEIEDFRKTKVKHAQSRKAGRRNRISNQLNLAAVEEVASLVDEE